MKSGNKEIGFGKQSIDKVFEEWYTVPSYQRHYVWESDNINDMLEDFASNYIEHNNEEYFLGSYIIQSKDKSNDLLDGQQRITTLFLLFAYLRDYEKSSDDVKSNCIELIFQKANKIKHISERIRLSYEIRGNVKKFIEEYLMAPGSITQHWDKIVKKANNKQECISIQRMCNALLCLDGFFTEHKDIDLDAFLGYILNNVVMIYISADSLEDAFRLFSVMNDRGQKLSNADILKSSNLEKIEDNNEMNEYAREWENMQEDLGNDFDRFLAYIRTMLLKKRPKMNLLDEYDKLVFKAGIIKQGKDFFKYVFEAYKDYNKLINLTNNEDPEYCTLIRILNECMPSTDWVPVVLSYGRKFGKKGLLEFTLKVACKNIADAVCGKAPSYRIDNLNNIMNIIEESTDANQVLFNKEFYSFNEQVFIANIQSEIYGRKYTYALLMLLEYKYKDKSEWKEFGTISIEHILPQNPKKSSKWVKDFNESEREYYTHKIGNLCLIGRRKNSSLGNLDYQEKLKKYFEKDISSFASTQKIYKTYPNEWTPETIQKNQERVINDLIEIFNIKRPISQHYTETFNPITTIDSKESNSKPGSSYMAQQKALYPKAYTPWTNEEDKQLLELYHNGKSVKELMEIFQRNQGAITSRISKLTDS